MSAFYTNGLEGLIKDEIELSTGVFKLLLLRGYTPPALDGNGLVPTHKFVSDLTGAGGGTIVATSAALSGQAVTGGVVDWDNSAFAAVAAGAACSHVALVQSSAAAGGADVAAGAQRLVLLIDSAGAGLPITPNGLDITINIANAFSIAGA